MSSKPAARTRAAMSIAQRPSHSVRLKQPTALVDVQALRTRALREISVNDEALEQFVCRQAGLKRLRQRAIARVGIGVTRAKGVDAAMEQCKRFCLLPAAQSAAIK